MVEKQISLYYIPQVEGSDIKILHWGYLCLLKYFLDFGVSLQCVFGSEGNKKNLENTLVHVIKKCKRPQPVVWL